MIKSLEDRIRENTKIQLGDLFGKGRIRNMVKGEDWHNEQKDLYYSAEKLSRATVCF